MPVPAKFDDVSKTASSVLKDDFEVSGGKFEAKTKTDLSGAIITTSLEIKDNNPAKLGLKIPKLLDIPGFSVDKLEYKNGGGKALECSVKKELHGIPGLVALCKSDLSDPTNSALDLTYTYSPSAIIKLETNPLKGVDKQSITGVMGFPLAGIGAAVLALKCDGYNVPNAGVHVANDKLFASVFAKSQFKEFVGHCSFQVNSDIKVAGTYSKGGKADGTWGIGCQAKIPGGVSAKAKLETGKALSVGFKKELSKGVNLIAGAQIKGEKTTYGWKLNVE